MPVEPTPARRDRRVLVVDDDHEARLVMSAFMAQAGFRVDAVADGAMALTMVRSQPPDVVLLDAMLPRIDGVSVCRAIKADPRTDRTPVVMITAYGNGEKRDESLAAGADEYMEKPFRVEQLLEVVDRLLRIREAARQLENAPLAAAAPRVGSSE